MCFSGASLLRVPGHTFLARQRTLHDVCDVRNASVKKERRWKVRVYVGETRYQVLLVERLGYTGMRDVLCETARAYHQFFEN